MRFLSAFRGVLLGLAALLLTAAPAGAISTASVSMVLTLDFQGAFFTDTLENAIDGVDYELGPIYNLIDSLPQPHTGVGSAAIAGNIMVNGSPFDDNVPLQDDDRIVLTISGNASADGVGSHYAAFYEDNMEISGSVFDEINFDYPSLTFVFDWDVLFTTTLDAEPTNGKAVGWSEGATDSMALWGNTGFAFGDVADGFPTMPQDNASGQIQIVTNFGDTDFSFRLNSSAFTYADGSVVPEPSTALLVGMGALGLLGLARRSRGA